MPFDSNNEIYVDNAATTSMSKDVLDAAKGKKRRGKKEGRRKEVS